MNSNDPFFDRPEAHAMLDALRGILAEAGLEAMIMAVEGFCQIKLQEGESPIALDIFLRALLGRLGIERTVLVRLDHCVIRITTHPAGALN